MRVLGKVKKITMFSSVAFSLVLIWLFILSIGKTQSLSVFFENIQNYSLVFFYLSSLFLLLQNNALSTTLKPIANMGKIGLTIYVCQNFLGSLLISLFGWSTEYTLIQSFVIALLVIIIELIGVNLYVRRFKQGPLEMIWRKMTYGFKSGKARSV